MELMLNMAALAALVPAALLAAFQKRDDGDDPRGGVFWPLVLVALAGALSWTWVQFAGGWRTGLASALWLTVAGAYAIYAVLSVASVAVARLLPLFAPYGFLLGIFATVWAQAPGRAVGAELPDSWLGVHIVISVVTYALFTLAAVAGLGVVLQERALKARAPSTLTAMLPAAADGETLQRRLMTAAAAVLGLGLASGMVIQAAKTGTLLALNHKTLLSLAAFAVIVGLIIMDRVSGFGGRRAARSILVAYLLLTLAYPGVKFVTDVVLR
jgi:ABC-type uncharacterized transport system permease subunit